MWIESPEIADPDLVTKWVTTTPMNAGSGPDGGGVELPGAVDQLLPQPGVCGLPAKPLKLRGAPNELSSAHCALQKVTELPTAPFLPMTKLPPPGANENPIAVQDAVAV